MGMLKSYLKLVLLFHRERRFSGSVCVLGNQEIWASYDDLVDCFREMGVQPYPPRGVRGHSSRMFASSPVLSTLARDFVHASVFFEMLGMKEYVDVDKFDADRPVLTLDLNEPVGPALDARFDLVIDGGTVEHIFDVKAVLANMIKMTKVGGHVMHIATFQPDHGFYSLSPCLFFEFYLANGFVDPECYLLFVDYERILETYAETHPFLRYEYGRTVLPPATEQAFLVFFTARKSKHVDAPVTPTQGVFVQAPAPHPVEPASPGQRVPSRLEQLLGAPLRLARRFLPRRREVPPSSPAQARGLPPLPRI